MADSSEHQGAPLPANEAQRLDALRGFGILDTAVERAFDDIVMLAAKLCDAPIALISLVDSARQWFKAEHGLGVRETPRAVSVCAHAIHQTELFEVPDTLEDPRFRHSPLVSGQPGMRFYAGAPLITPEGFALGTVCVLDRRPRHLDPGQREVLLALTRQAMVLMELHRSLSDAQDARKHLGRLLTVAGHDLRQPLQTVSMSLEVVRLKAPQAELAPVIRQGLAAAQKLGAELDELARASQVVDTAAPRREAFALEDLFGELALTWRPLAQQKQLAFRCVSTRLKVVSDRKMLGTILGNLIGNAIKYTDRGKVLVGCRRRGPRIELCILDTGVGIASEQMNEMFLPFRKANAHSAGLGLGLSIVRSTSDLLGHRVTIDSSPGRGTAARILLPRDDG